MTKRKWRQNQRKRRRSIVTRLEGPLLQRKYTKQDSVTETSCGASFSEARLEEVKRVSIMSKNCQKNGYSYLGCTKNSSNIRLAPEWFVENYQQGCKWALEQQVEYWKNKAETLEYENCLLHQQLRYIWQHGNVTHNIVDVEGGSQISESDWESQTESVHNDDECDYEAEPETGSEELEFEVDNNMLDFLEQSLRHKLELRQQREKENIEKEKDKRNGRDVEQKPDSLLRYEPVGAQRNREMFLLYGSSAPMILGMEAAMQLAYNRNCDRHCPPYWPNIALKL